MVEDNLKKKADEIEEARKDKPEPADAGKGDKSETDVEVKRLNANTERLKKAVAENEQAKALASLSGKSEAGQVMKEETQEDKDKAQVKDMLETFG